MSYGRAEHSHLQGARKRQADHNNGGRQHTDGDQSAFGVASHNKGLTAGWRRRKNWVAMLSFPEGPNAWVRGCEVAHESIARFSARCRANASQGSKHGLMLRDALQRVQNEFIAPSTRLRCDIPQHEALTYSLYAIAPAHRVRFAPTSA